MFVVGYVLPGAYDRLHEGGTVEGDLDDSVIAGEYVVVEHDDSRVVLERSLDPSSAEMHERHGTRPLTDEEFEERFGDLPDEFGE